MRSFTLDKCCFCINLTIGCQVIAVFNIIISIYVLYVNISDVRMRKDNFEKWQEDPQGFYSEKVQCAMWMNSLAFLDRLYRSSSIYLHLLWIPYRRFVCHVLGMPTCNCIAVISFKRLWLKSNPNLEKPPMHCILHADDGCWSNVSVSSNYSSWTGQLELVAFIHHRRSFEHLLSRVHILALQTVQSQRTHSHSTPTRAQPTLLADINREMFILRFPE